MFLSKFISDVVPQIDVEKLLLEQQETIKKLDAISREVKNIKDHPSKEIIKNMYDSSNTLQKPIFDMSNAPLVEKADKFFNAMDKVGNYISHPILIANAIAGASYWVCLFVAIGGVMFYLIGHKKGLKYTGGSILSYTLIQVINVGLNAL